MAEEISFEEEINGLLDREPFVPFVIVVTSGDRYEVTDPRRVAMGGSTVVILPPQSPHVFFRKNQIVAVEVHEAAT